MFRCPFLAGLGVILVIWGFFGSIFIPKFLIMFVIGIVLGLMFSKDI